MVLGLLNWLKETRFFERKKKIIIKKLKFARKESSYQDERKSL